MMMIEGKYRIVSVIKTPLNPEAVNVRHQQSFEAYHFAYDFNDSTVPNA